MENEEELKKGCGRWYPDESISFPRKEPTLIGSTCGETDFLGYLHICPVCKAELKGFLAGQLASQEKCLKIIEELKNKLPDEVIRGNELYGDVNRCWMYKEDFEELIKELTQKIKEMKE